MKHDLPPLRYDRGHEIERNRRAERADAENHKRGRDIEVGPARVVLTASDGSRHALVVSPAGALSTTPL
jgi:hypothetical protein